MSVVRLTRAGAVALLLAGCESGSEPVCGAPCQPPFRHAVVEGRVLPSSGQAVRSAHVLVGGNSDRADEQGRYTIRLEQGYDEEFGPPPPDTQTVAIVAHFETRITIDTVLVDSVVVTVRFGPIDEPPPVVTADVVLRIPPPFEPPPV